jgi:CheY-like chemotaxis protein
VLVVDDHAGFREMARALAVSGGLDVVAEAADGATALALCEAHHPDLVLLDIGLPDLDGFEVARRIRARLGAAVRLIGLSGYGDEEAHREGREAGFDAHLVKPVSPEALLQSLDAP